MRACVSLGRRSLRRRALLGAGACLAGALWGRSLGAMGRIPIGGEIMLRVPWPTGSLDPHDLHDPLAALFGAAVADPVYALDSQGRPYPTLADGMPAVEDGVSVVRLRPGLRTAAGRPLGGLDLAWSIERAKQGGGAGLIAQMGLPEGRGVRAHASDALATSFGTAGPAELATLLASPLLALLPRGFLPRRPDGTGPFAARVSDSELELVRNAWAARGPSFLDRVLVRSAGELGDSLRAFEAGSDDVGWLGAGLHRDRPGARRFDFGEAGWIVLVTGREAEPFAAPGVAQRLVDSLPEPALAGLGLRATSAAGPGTAWGGPAADLLYAQGAGQMHAVAEAVAALLSRPGHEIAARAVAREALRRKRRDADLALALDVVRPLGPRRLDALLSLATADRPALGRELGRSPPKLGPGPLPRTATAALRLAVVGALRVTGAASPGTELAALPGGGLDLGSSYRWR
ncbi:MAG: hypothetical protein HY744_04555 [Deltaproteobacteria bacterium]|nr:hypothetical protein [Deltaproteobacteria bacterium]